MTIGLALTFLTVTTCCDEVDPTTIGPKLILVGETVNAGATPVPATLTAYDLPFQKPLEVPIASPTLVGENA